MNALLNNRYQAGCHNALNLVVSLWLLLSGTVLAYGTAEPWFPEPSFFVRPWTVDDGTADNTAMGALRRTDGYMWVVTRVGLFRYDGEKYISAPHVSISALPGVVTPVMLEDRRGRLWLTRDNGAVICIDGSNTRIFTTQDGLPGLKPYSMAEDGEGSIWISYFAAAPLFRIKDAQVQDFASADGLAGEDATRLIHDARGSIWFVRGRQVGIMRDGRQEPLLTKELPVIRVAAVGNGGIWLSDGRYIWKCGESGLLEPLGQVPAGAVKVMYEDRRGRLWVGVNMESTGALFYYDAHVFRPVPVSCQAIINLSDDSEGNIWAATRRGGLVQVRLRTVEISTLPGDLSGRGLSFCETITGERFVAGEEGNLWQWMKSGWNDIAEGKNATCVAADPRGGIWFGTSTRGLFKWRDGHCYSTGNAKVLAASPIRALLAVSNGDLWIAQELPGSLFRLRDGQQQSFALPRSSGQVSALAEDKEGIVWAACLDGRLFSICGETVADRTPAAVQPRDGISSLHTTPDGSIWIGYETRGLGWLKNGKFNLFGQKQGLGSEPVSCIMSDDAGRLWCANDHGIFRIKRDDLQAVADEKRLTVRIVMCGRGEGRPFHKISSKLWPRDGRNRSGELCMLRGFDVVVIRPERIVDYPPPAVLIDRLLVNGQPVAVYENPSSTMVDLHGLTGRLSLGQGVHQLGLEFSVVSFTGSENVRFRYRLEGLDDNWVDAGPQRAAYFGQVPPGDYRFHVVACNNEGTWSEAGASLAFSVVPFFWQTKWFRAGSLFGLIIASWLVVGMMVRRHHQRRMAELERQQAVEQERGRIARDMHDDLGAGLTQISLNTAMLQNSAVTPDVAGKLLGEIDQRSRDLVTALDEIVWAVNPKNDSLLSMTRYFSEFAQNYLLPANIACRLEVASRLPDVPVLAEQRHQLFLAFKEALNNIMRHSVATELRLEIKADSQTLAVTLTDNGRGFVPGPVREGADGLTNMRVRLESLGGSCVVTSEPGRGTKVVFKLPLKHNIL